ARLEPLNNEYGTWICVSQATLALAGPEYLVRFLDLLAVRGKTARVSVYEWLGLPRDAELAACWAPLLEPYGRGIALYRAREFSAADELFRSALDTRGSDGPSALYVQRCAELMADPPPSDWNGVYVMQHK